MNYLAIDIGASSGRHIIGCLKNGKLETKEIYRFKNGVEENNGSLLWDTKALFSHIIEGMKKAKEYNPVSVGIDTWGVDFVLLDKNKKLLGQTVAYRDKRTEGVPENCGISLEWLYSKTGIQKQSFNTVYQLIALKKQNPQIIENAEYFLMIPDYFAFLLTGKIRNEYTNASTTGLLNAKERDWDREILSAIGIPQRIFQKPETVGEYGELLPEIAEQVGYNCKVYMVATHDTGSAYIAVPAKNENSVYISSGTWSLLGVESNLPLLTVEGRRANFTNEGGIEGTYRVLKNIMGLWMLQNFRKEINTEDFTLPAKLAKNSSFSSVVDVEDESFLAPESMCNAVKAYCKKTSQPVPESNEDIAACIYNSLAKGYKRAINELEELAGRKYECINIVGGGSMDEYLCELTAKETGLPVYAGPAEGTAIGNIFAQMMAIGQVRNKKEAREILANSIDLKEYLV